jgi:1-deoxy-D-xylulose-5-phosphate synthase
VTFAAGLACEGMRPVVAIYSTFLQRAYDQVIHDVALQKLPVVFAIDRAGIVGADGATHTGAYDIAALRCLPGMVLMAPSDELECRRMLSTAFALDGPSAVRYPRGAGIGAAVDRADLSTLPVGRALLRRQGRAPAGRRLALLAFGPVLHTALKAAEELDATVVDMRFIKPLDQDMLQRIAAAHDAVVTVEEGAVRGGAGSACLEELQSLGWTLPVLSLGLPDTWLEHGDPAQVTAAAGLDAAGLLRSIRERFAFLSGPTDAQRREAANS